MMYTMTNIARYILYPYLLPVAAMILVINLDISHDIVSFLSTHYIVTATITIGILTVLGTCYAFNNKPCLRYVVICLIMIWRSIQFTIVILIFPPLEELGPMLTILYPIIIIVYIVDSIILSIRLSSDRSRKYSETPSITLAINQEDADSKSDIFGIFTANNEADDPNMLI